MEWRAGRLCLRRSGSQVGIVCACRRDMLPCAARSVRRERTCAICWCSWPGTAPCSASASLPGGPRAAAGSAEGPSSAARDPDGGNKFDAAGAGTRQPASDVSSIGRRNRPRRAGETLDMDLTIEELGVPRWIALRPRSEPDASYHVDRLRGQHPGQLPSAERNVRWGGCSR